MNNSNLKLNTPHAAKFINSFRSNSHSSTSAIQDLIDNSIDAKASKIQLFVEFDGTEYQIILADNGKGMDLDTLVEANTLGSSVEKSSKDLGKFGMGLITAGFSISKQIKIITYNNSEYLTSINDVDTIIENNSFVFLLRASSQDEIQLFRKYNQSQTGTLIILSKSDRFILSNSSVENQSELLHKFLFGSNKNLANLLNHNSSLEEGLVFKLGLIYRKFIKMGLRLSVNGSNVNSIDPMFTDQGSILLESKEIDLSDIGFNLNFKVSCYFINPNIIAKDYGINQKNQGFYFLRNNRQIAQGESLGYIKHNDANRFRAEIEFSSDLDEHMGVDFQKSSVNRINEEIKCRIIDFATPHLKYVKAQSKKKERINLDVPTRNLHNKVEKIIKDKTGKKAEFTTRDMGSSGSIFQADQLGKTLEIKLNSSHKFYEKYYVENKDEKVKVLSDLMIFSLANSQLHNSDDRSIEIIDNFIESFSKNIRNIVADIEL